MVHGGSVMVREQRHPLIAGLVGLVTLEAVGQFECLTGEFVRKRVRKRPEKKERNDPAYV